MDGHGPPPSLLHGLKLGQARPRRGVRGRGHASHRMAWQWTLRAIIAIAAYGASLSSCLALAHFTFLTPAWLAHQCVLSLQSPLSSPFCRFQLPIPCRIPFTIWMKARLQGFIITRTSLSLVFMFVSCILVAPPPKQRLPSWLLELPRLRKFRDGELVLELSSVRFLKSCCREEGTGSWLRMLCDYCLVCRSERDWIPA